MIRVRVILSVLFFIFVIYGIFKSIDFIIYWIGKIFSGNSSSEISSISSYKQLLTITNTLPTVGFGNLAESIFFGFIILSVSLAIFSFFTQGKKIDIIEFVNSVSKYGLSIFFFGALLWLVYGKIAPGHREEYISSQEQDYIQFYEQRQKNQARFESAQQKLAKISVNGFQGDSLRKFITLDSLSVSVNARDDQDNLLRIVAVAVETLNIKVNGSIQPETYYVVEKIKDHREYMDSAGKTPHKFFLISAKDVYILNSNSVIQNDGPLGFLPSVSHPGSTTKNSKQLEFNWYGTPNSLTVLNPINEQPQMVNAGTEVKISVSAKYPEAMTWLYGRPGDTVKYFFHQLPKTLMADAQRLGLKPELRFKAPYGALLIGEENSPLKFKRDGDYWIAYWYPKKNQNLTLKVNAIKNIPLTKIGLTIPWIIEIRHQTLQKSAIASR